MQLLFAFLAKFAESAQDGTINAMGADFDRVAVGALPAKLDIWVVAKFHVGPEGIDNIYQASLELADPENHVIALGNREISSEGVPVEQARVKGYKATMFVQIGIGIKAPGVYRVNLSVDGEQLKSWPLEVAKVG